MISSICNKPALAGTIIYNPRSTSPMSNIICDRSIYQAKPLESEIQLVSGSNHGAALLEILKHSVRAGPRLVAIQISVIIHQIIYA